MGEWEQLVKDWRSNGGEWVGEDELAASWAGLNG